jgi:hypothetical protein
LLRVRRTALPEAALAVSIDDERVRVVGADAAAGSLVSFVTDFGARFEGVCFATTGVRGSLRSVLPKS